MKFWPCTLSLFFMLCPMLLMGGPAITNCSAQANRHHDASWQRTVDLYNNVPCLTEDEMQYGREIISGLSYNAKRAFRPMCDMPGINFERSQRAWEILLELQLSYEQVLAYEEWSQLEGVTADLALTALPKIKTLGYEAGKAFSRYCALPKIRAEHALNTIPLLIRFDDAQNRAVQSFFTIQGLNGGQALDGLGALARLQKHRARAADALASIPGMTSSTMLDALPLLAQLHQDDAWNARTLYLDKEMTPGEAWFWLTSYFATPPEIQERQFDTLSPDRQKILLRTFYDAGEELIWKINNLHAVTDRFGFEVSNHELNGYSNKEIEKRFAELSPLVISRFADRFYSSGKKSSRTAILKSATAQERVETGRRLTSANIYALLAQGSELYDSSFRNILVPILKKRIGQSHASNLLAFLHAIDAENQFVSNFIVSLAQKGKLTTFFPVDPVEQEQVLDLVAASAFQDEDSIILFSATFMYLLEVLQPSARSFLVKKMSQQAEAGTATYSKLITVILQYYLQEFPQLLGPKERTVITRLVVKNGATNLHQYLVTPFAQWKSDGTLKSISVFHPDDDGRDSFRSNARMLLKSGYMMQLSDSFSIKPLSEKLQQDISQVIRSARAKPSAGLSRLFSSMQRHGYSVAFTRQLNGLTINHATVVYSGEKSQELLMEHFILSGIEMFAQRGHSYWRSEQITDPLNTLMKNGKIGEPDLEMQQRFLSLGSCGGVKAYTRLDRLFQGNVDILATIGTGLAVINDPYNKNFFEVIAKKPSSITWKDVGRELSFIFKGGHGRDYLQPGSLPAILHKIMNEERRSGTKKPLGNHVTGRSYSRENG